MKKKREGAPAWLARLCLPNQLSKRDIWLSIIPALLWWGATQARPVLIEPRCKGPGAVVACSPESVNAIDRIGLGQERGDADGFSYATQNISGYLAIGGPILWSAGMAVAGVLTPELAAASAGVDLLLLGQASAWNGLLNEICHAAIRRPRPFVYSDPAGRGADPSHYTSFYSGHTSFAAVAGLSLLLMLLARGAPAGVLAGAAVSWQALTISTAYFRIMAGRHFLTDVLAAAAIGSAIAVLVFLSHKDCSSPRT